MKRRRVLVKLWIPTLLLLVIPVLLLNIGIVQLMNGITKNANDNLLSSTERSSYLLSQIFDESLSYTEQLLSNSKVTQLYKIEKIKKPRDYSAISTASKAFNEYSPFTDGYQLCLYLNRSDILAVGNIIYEDLEKYYPQLFSFGALSFQEFRELSVQHQYGIRFYPQVQGRINRSLQHGLAYSYPINTYNDETNGGMMLVFVTGEALREYLPAVAEDGYSCIFDTQGQVLFSVGQQPEGFANVHVPTDKTLGRLPDGMLGDDYLASYAQLPLGLSVVAVHNRTTALQDVQSLITLVWVINLAAVVSCIFVSALMAAYRRRQIEGTISLLSGYVEEAPDFYGSINRAVNKLVNSNVSLQDQNRRQQTLLRGAFWDKALSHTATDDLNDLADKAGMRVPGKRVCLLLLQAKSEAEAVQYEMLDVVQAYRLALLGVLEERYNCCILGMEQIAVLVEIENATAYKTQVSETVKGLPGAPGGVRLFCAASPAFDDFNELRSSYVSTQAAANSRTDMEEAVFWCDSLDFPLENSFYLPDTLQTQIVVGIKNGDFTQVRKNLEMILKRNFGERSIDSTMYELLLSKLRLALVAAHDPGMPLTLDRIVAETKASQSDAHSFSAVFKLSQLMSAYYSEQARDGERGLKHEIEAYFEENFTSNHFSLTMIADHFNFSESHFSKLFKELMEDTFLVYLDEKRMRLADTLLAQTDSTLETIAQQVGYGSPNAFSRAYKRFYGIAPSQRRKL